MDLKIMDVMLTGISGRDLRQVHLLILNHKS